MSAAAVSSGGTISVTVTNPTPGGGTSSAAVLTLDDFTLSGPTGNVSLAGGVATPVTVTLTPSANGFAGLIQLAVSNMPSGWTAQFLSGSTIAPGNAVGTVTLTVTAPATVAANHAPARRSPSGGLPPGFGDTLPMLVAIVLPIGRLKWRAKGHKPGEATLMLWLLALCSVGLSLSGCGGGFNFGGRGQQTVTMTITGTSGSLQHATNVTFVVTSK
jgi:hypothetical protein